MAKKKPKRKPRKRKASTKKNGAQPRPPIALPQDAANPANAEQIDGGTRNGCIDDQDKRESHKMDWPTILTIVFTGVVAAATVGLVFTAAYQLNAIRSQIHVAQDTLELMRQGQRAWLSVTQPRLAKLVAGERVSCTVPIKNSGNTPGFIDTAAIMCLLVPGDTIKNDPSPLIEAHAKGTARSSPVAPGIEWNLRVIIAPVLNEEQLQSVVDGGTLLCVCGYIYYLDTSGQRRTTKLCFVYDPATEIMVAYRNYNYMD